MKPSFLVIKGCLTQRQFDIIGRTWHEFQKANGVIDTLPAIQLPENAHIEIIPVDIED